MLLFLLAVVLAAPLPDAPDARARALVKTCEQIKLASGVGFMCPGALVQLTSVPGDDEAAALEEQLARLRVAWPGIGFTERTEFKVAGRPRPGARFRVDPGAPQAPNALGLVAAYAPGGGMVRSISCVMPEPGAGMTARCEALLDGLGAVGPGVFAESATDPALLGPKFLGRPVSLPKGCAVRTATDAGFQIACKDGAALAYVKQVDEAAARKSLAYLRDSELSSAGGTQGAPRPCAIGGVSASCDVLFEGDRTTRIGVAIVAKQAVVVSCAQQAARKGVHPLCAQVMRF